MVRIHGNCLGADGLLLRGNLHSHTTLSDGVLDPPTLIRAYEERGYHFLAISDHHIVTPVDEYRFSTSLILLSALEVCEP
ncbi:MAG: PHP domain-containing protein, partial [Armatimonadota bacterium]